MTIIGNLPYALLFLVVLATTFGVAHRWLEYAAGLRRPVAVALALAAGIAAGWFIFWLTWDAPQGTCIDYAPGIYGTC